MVKMFGLKSVTPLLALLFGLGFDSSGLTSTRVGVQLASAADVRSTWPISKPTATAESDSADDGITCVYTAADEAAAVKCLGESDAVLVDKEEGSVVMSWLISRGFFDAALRLLDIAAEAGMDLSTAVHQTSSKIRSKLQLLSDALSKSSLAAAGIPPAFEWAQSPDSVYLNGEFAGRYPMEVQCTYLLVCARAHLRRWTMLVLLEHAGGGAGRQSMGCEENTPQPLPSSPYSLPLPLPSTSVAAVKFAHKLDTPATLGCEVPTSTPPHFTRRGAFSLLAAIAPEGLSICQLSQVGEGWRRGAAHCAAFAWMGTADDAVSVSMLP